MYAYICFSVFLPISIPYFHQASRDTNFHIFILCCPRKQKKKRKNINCPSCHLQKRGWYVILHWVTSGNTWLAGITNLGLCSKIYTTKLVLLSTCVISTFKFIRILLATKILRRNNGLFKETLIMIDHDSSRLKFHFRKNLNKKLWKS